MKKLVVLIVFVIGLSIAFRLARTQLSGIENPIMTEWPRQIIFGFYFAVLTLAIQALQPVLEPDVPQPSPRQKLLLLVLIGVCLDLVLVNIQETTTHNDASYGFVVVWDVATFFVWLRTIELCRFGMQSAFRLSCVITIAPLFKLGREVLFLPYPSPAGRAYLDLAFGDLPVCLWSLIELSRSGQHNLRNGLKERVLSTVVFMGCAYWLLVALENVLLLVWPPLEARLDHALEHVGAPPLVLNCLYFVVAIGVTALARRKDVFRLGTHFGMRRVNAPGQQLELSQQSKPDTISS
jgi:hypothetical protein